MAASKEGHEVTLPEGVSLRRIAEVLVDAWEVGAHQWTDTPPQLREGSAPTLAMPVPRDAVDLFRLLHERQVPCLLVGGMARLTYVKGRNTKDMNLLISMSALAASIFWALRP